MRFVLCGLSLIAQDFLSFFAKDNAITLIDKDGDLLERLEQMYDLQTIAGHPCDLKNLEKANLDQECFVMACGENDEENLILSRLTKKMGVKFTAVYLRNPIYLTKDARALLQQDFNINLIFSDEEALEEAVLNSLNFPSTFLALSFFSHRMSLLGFFLPKNSSLKNQTLKQLKAQPKFKKILGLVRNGHFLPFEPKLNVQENDGLIFCIPAKSRSRLTKDVGYVVSTLGPKTLAFMETTGLRTEFLHELEKRGHTFLIVSAKKEHLKIFSCAFPYSFLFEEDPTLSDSWCKQGIFIDYAFGLAKTDIENFSACFVAHNYGIPHCIARQEIFKGPLQKIGIERVLRPSISMMNMLLKAIKPRFVTQWSVFEPHGFLIEVVLKDHVKALGWSGEKFQEETQWYWIGLMRQEEFIDDSACLFQVKDHGAFWVPSCAYEDIFHTLEDIFGEV